MPDIALRFNRDMLVLSTPLNYQLESQGFTCEADRAYVSLCEPELIEEAFKLEKMLDTPCFVTATEGITHARLAVANFEGQAAEMARIAYEICSRFKPQHLIAAIGPTGLPLDSSSAASLRQSKGQYQDAVKLLAAYPFDAILFSGFANGDDAQCALMGARAVYDGPLMITLRPDDEGGLSCGRSLFDAASLCVEYGADVVGVSSPAGAEELVSLVVPLAAGLSVPLMVEIEIDRPEKRASVWASDTGNNPYASPDALVDAAWALREAGVQFLRAGGNASPAYTGALVATVMGHDVKVDL